MATDQLNVGVPIVRIFKAKAHPGSERALAEKLAITSAALVKERPGLIGYFAGQPAQAEGRDFVFITLWRDFDGMRELYGEAWRESLLPPGYESLIETCTVEHYQLTDRLLRSV